MDYKDKEFWEAVNKETSKQMIEEMKKMLAWTAKMKKEMSEKKKKVVK